MDGRLVAIVHLLRYCDELQRLNHSSSLVHISGFAINGLEKITFMIVVLNLMLIIVVVKKNIIPAFKKKKYLSKTDLWPMPPTLLDSFQSE
jgi:hypothetical protein